MITAFSTNACWSPPLNLSGKHDFGSRILSLTLPGSLDHKLSNLLLDPSLATFRAFYLALLVFAYGHHECEELFAVEALVLICRHSHLPARAHHGQRIIRPALKQFYKDYSELPIVMSTKIGMLRLKLPAAKLQSASGGFEM